MTDKYRLPFGDTEIAFTLKRTNRRSIAVKVYPDLRVEVTAPRFSSKRFILKTIGGKAPWIIKKQKEFADRPPLPEAPEYRTGELFRFMGTPVELNVSEGKPGVCFDDGCINLYAPADSTREKRKRLLLEWYRREAKTVFAGRLKECLRLTSEIGISEAPEIICKKMRRRWGSCTADNRICLNIELVSAPVELIDYVIIHELCHIREHNHSPRYYALLSRVCPDWKALRRTLNETVQIRLV